MMILLFLLAPFINYLVWLNIIVFCILVESLINLSESIGKLCNEESIQKLK